MVFGRPTVYYEQNIVQIYVLYFLSEGWTIIVFWCQTATIKTKLYKKIYSLHMLITTNSTYIFSMRLKDIFLAEIWLAKRQKTVSVVLKANNNKYE